MKKIISILSAVSLLASTSVATFGADKEARQPDVYVDGEIVEFADQNAYITDEGRTLVPARGVFEAMDCLVSWDAENYVVTVSNETLKKEILLTINDRAMKVVTGGKEEVKTLDVPATLMNDRTMIPLRAVSEALGCEVGWDDNAYRVDIASVEIEKEKAPLSAKIYLKAPTGTVRVGDTISVPIMLSDAKGLKGAMFKVKWDPKMLKMLELDSKNNKAFGGYTDAPDLFDEICDVNHSGISGGTITVAGSSAKVIETESKDYSLGNLHFKVLSDAANKNAAIEFDTEDMGTNGNDGESNRAFSGAEGITIAVKEKASSGGGGGGGGSSSRPSKPSSGSGSGSGSGAGSGGSTETPGNPETPDTPDIPDEPDTPDEPEEIFANFTINYASGAPGEEIEIDLLYDTTELVNLIGFGGITFSDESIEIVGFEFSEEANALLQSISTYDEDMKSVIALFTEPVMFSGVLGTFRIRISESASGEIAISATVSSKNEGVGQISTGVNLGAITVA